MVRGGANPTRFAWADGCLLAYAGKPLAQADAPVHSLGVCLDGTVMSVEASEPEATLRIDVGQAKSFTLNGKPVAQPTIKEGMFWPFADQPRAMVADDRDAFEPITKGEEWECKTDPASWAGTYLQHETDPGRHESGNFVLEVPENGKYRLEVYLPRVLVTPSDRVEYKVNAEGKPAAQSGPLVAVRSAGRTHALVVNHQAMCGWTPLGEFTLRKGKLRIMARNATETDGVYFIADAMRLISVE